MGTSTPTAERRRGRRGSDEPASPVSVAIVGRPNVGKSTLFNRLVGRRLALVDDQPGVTRDLREGAAKLGDLRFTAIDTAGLEDAEGDDLPARMRRLTERAVDEADICLFVMDARDGVTATDQIFADILRKRAPRVLLAANKAEGRAGGAGLIEAFSLGLGEPVAISAEHGEGMGDLYAALEPLVAEVAEAYQAAAEQAAEAVLSEETSEGVEEGEEGEDPDRALRIAVIGRPNAGKSTLVNQILGEDRLLTGPEAGITRDSIGLEVDWDGRRMKIFDTAGLRKKARVQQKLEKLSVADALRAAKFAEVAILLLDVQNPLETQDLKIADLIEKEGRAVVVAVNKWDLEPAKQAKLAELKREIERLLPQLRGAPVVALSGLTGAGLPRLKQAVLDAYAAWNIRVSTAKLNRWLRLQEERHPPPAPSGRRIRLRYMTQAKTRPPTFVLFASKPDDLPESYRRYLTNALRDDFKLSGSPLRLIVKATENPYAAKAKKRKIY